MLVRLNVLYCMAQIKATVTVDTVKGTDFGRQPTINSRPISSATNTVSHRSSLFSSSRRGIVTVRAMPIT